MGSDMAMEMRNFRPRPAKAHWNGDSLVVQKDSPISGYYVWYEGVVTDSNRIFIEKEVVIPDKPEPKPDPYKVIERVLHKVALQSYWSTSDANEIWNVFQEDKDD